MKKTVAIICALLQLSCWYSFREATTERRKSLYIKPFDNQTAEPELPEKLLSGLSDELSKIALLVPKESADYYIEGSITEVKEIAYTYTPEETPKEFKITLKGKFRILRRDGTVIEETELEGWGTYPASTGNRDEAISSGIKMLVGKISDLVRSL